MVLQEEEGKSRKNLATRQNATLCYGKLTMGSDAKVPGSNPSCVTLSKFFILSVPLCLKQR
jgi:hypothetical protein